MLEAEEYAQTILEGEVLDMLLKWLTWLLVGRKRPEKRHKTIQNPLEPWAQDAVAHQPQGRASKTKKGYFGSRFRSGVQCWTCFLRS